jgi:hypothetical protein
MTTEILGLDELVPSQGNPDVTHNNALRQLEGRMVRALDKDLTVAPSTPANGDVYIVASGATGTWSGKDKKIAHFWGGGWKYYTPIHGYSLMVVDEDLRYFFDGTNWEIEPSAPLADASVTYSKIQDVSTTSRVLGRKSAGAGPIEEIVLDTDGTMTANSDSRLSSQKAMKTYVDNAVTGLLDFKGNIDASTNPNYPAASKGDVYVISVAGKVGGASGTSVDVGDVVIAKADNAGGTEASVGTSWFSIEHNGVYGVSATPASTTEVLTGTDNSKVVTSDALAALWEQGSDVASASTISLGEGGYFNITGTTTITDIDFGTDKAGRKAVLKFAGVLTLTHSGSTLILPTGANIVTAAGDTATFISEGSDVVRCVGYQRADGTALAASGGGGGSGDLVLISEVVTSSSATDVTFSSIATTWRDLEIRVRGRGSSSSGWVAIRIQLNGDTSTNYRRAQWGSNSQSQSGAESGSSDSYYIPGYIPDSSALSGAPGAITCHIMNYKDTTWHKVFLSESIYMTGTAATSYNQARAGGTWISTSAINAVKVFLASGNFVDGTVISLYGRK